MKKLTLELLSSRKYPEADGDIMIFMYRTPRKNRKNNRPSKIDILIDQFNSFSVDFKSFKTEITTRMDNLEVKVDKIDKRIDNLVTVNSLKE